VYIFLYIVWCQQNVIARARLNVVEYRSRLTRECIGSYIICYLCWWCVKQTWKIKNWLSCKICMLKFLYVCRWPSAHCIYYKRPARNDQYLFKRISHFEHGCKSKKSLLVSKLARITIPLLKQCYLVLLTFNGTLAWDIWVILYVLVRYRSSLWFLLKQN